MKSQYKRDILIPRSTTCEDGMPSTERFLLCVFRGLRQAAHYGWMAVRTLFWLGLAVSFASLAASCAFTMLWPQFWEAINYLNADLPGLTVAPFVVLAFLIGATWWTARNIRGED